MNTSEYYFLTDIFRGKGGILDVCFRIFNFLPKLKGYVMLWNGKKKTIKRNDIILMISKLYYS